MSIALASAWRPRGELRRFVRIWPQLDRAYTSIAISLPPGTDLGGLKPLQEHIKITLIVTRDWSWGRHAALRAAMESAPDTVHYADFDRLVRWVETRPEEWRGCLERILQADCTIVERSEAAWASHPQALRQTERTANMFMSHFLGEIYDLSGGSKGFSRRAARFILANSPESPGNSGRALGTDAEWPVLLHRGGFRLQSVQVDGLDWESADRYQVQAVSFDDQRLAAQAYDADPHNWQARLRIAQEIIESGLDAAHRPLIYP
jgi:hypothetical protein